MIKETYTEISTSPIRVLPQDTSIFLVNANGIGDHTCTAVCVIHNTIQVHNLTNTYKGKDRHERRKERRGDIE